MNMNKLKELSQWIPLATKDLLLDITNNTPDFNVYLGGGYLRDILTGKTPKDVDIFFVPKTEDAVIGNEFIPTGCMVNYRKGVDDIVISSDMEARGLQRLVGLWSTKHYPSQEVQYIIYKKPMSLLEVAADFDMGICQITYDPVTDSVVYTDGFVKGHTEKVIECFHQYDDYRTVTRFDRMQDKFPDYKVVGKPDVKSLPTSHTTSNRSHADSV